MKPPVEKHPLEPFLPPDARLLILGSFPPPKRRWCMEFYYPNPQNDMWRIFGLAFFGDKNHFVNADGRTFDKTRIVSFAQERGVAFYDTASEVIRLKANASDQFLEIAKATDIAALLARIPECRALATTGEKATDALCEWTRAAKPTVGGHSEFTFGGKKFLQFRMPSSSRAYPKPLAEKAAMYAGMFRDAGVL